MKIRNIFAVLLATLFLVAACAPAATPAPTNSPVPTQVPTDTEEPTAEPTPVPTDTPVPTEEPLVVTDDLGNELTFEELPQRIVTLSPSVTETLFTLGAGGLVVGRDTNSTRPEAAKDVKDLGSLWQGLPTEEILALEPDLVIAAQIISEDQVKQLQDVGLKVYWQKNPQELPGLYENIRDLARLTGQEEEAQELVASYQKRVEDVEEKLADVEERPVVFYELDATDPSNPYTAGEGTFISKLITKAKGENLGDALEGDYAQISSEELIAQDPDIILLGDAPFGVSPEDVAERPGWSDITAVKEDQVYPFDPYLLSVPGPGLVEGFEELARAIHPEVFEK